LRETQSVSHALSVNQIIDIDRTAHRGPSLHVLTCSR
jgi:hypothetical protein